MNKKDTKSKEFKISGKLSIKEKGEEFYVDGFIATTHPDEVNDIIPVATLYSMADSINSREFMDSNAVSIHHDREDIIPIGVGSDAEVRPMGDGHYGLWAETHLNKTHPDFEDVKYQIENGFISGFSIEYFPIEEHTVNLDGKSLRSLDNLDLRGYGFAGPRTIANPNAMIENFGEKELYYKEMISTKSKEVNMVQKKEDETPEVVEEKPTEEPKEEAVEDKPAEEKQEEEETVTEEKELKELREFKKDIETKEVREKAEVKAKEDSYAYVKEKLMKEIPTLKPMLVSGQGTVIESKELVDWKEKVFDNKYSIKEQLDSAGRYAASVGAFDRQGKDIWSRKEKNWKVDGMQFKALETDTNKTADTDYYQSAAELNDIYDPIIYNVLNDKTTLYGLLNKKDYSAYSNIQVRIRRVRNTSANAYSEGGAITKDNTTRLKLQQPFKYYKAGVQVTGQMMASARGAGGIGDVFGQEVSDAALDLLKDINSDLFGIKGAIADEEVTGMEYYCDSTNYTALYGHTRSSFTVPLATGGDDAMSSAAISKKQLRKMIRTVEINGAHKSSLLIVCQHTQKDFILGLFDDAQRFNAVSARGGFEGLPTFDGVPIHADDNCNNDVVFLIDTDHYWIGVQVPPTYEDLAKTDDSRSGFIKTYLNTMCTAPNHCYQADGLATS